MRFRLNASAQDVRRDLDSTLGEVKVRLKNQTVSKRSVTCVLGQASDERLPLSTRFEHHCVFRDYQLVIRVEESRTPFFVHRRNCLRNHEYGPSLDYLVATVQRQRELLLFLDDRIQCILHPFLYPSLHRG